MADPIALLALGIDAAIGWPAGLYRRVGHPVGGFARIIGWCERHGNDHRRSGAVRRATGIATMAAVIMVAILVAGGIGWAADRLLGEAGWIAIALCAAPGLAQRSLYDHVRPVAQALAAGDMDAARRSVAMIAGRDTATLDAAGVARAAIESLAESFCDGVVAPLFWLMVAGLPGLWAYKAINTADSLIGHREARWRAFGWAAARIDDVANFVPARLSGIVLCLAGLGGWRTMVRDARRHASPNAGWPEAAMAGVLGIRVAGPVAYDGVMQDKAWIGDGRAPDAADLRRALALYLRGCGLLWIVAGVVAWAL